MSTNAAGAHMDAGSLRIPYDHRRWVHVPLRFPAGEWRTVDDWVDWFATEACSVRLDDPGAEPEFEELARDLATLPNEDVVARFLYFPLDHAPGSFADVRIARRDGNAQSPSDLLPELGVTIIKPEVTPSQSPALAAAVRRMSLSLVIPDDDAEPRLSAKAELLGVSDNWVVYISSEDSNVSGLEERLDDLEALFRLIDPEAAS